MRYLKITHETTYRYASPVRFGPHRIVLRPREGHDLRVEEMTLEISPDHDLEWSRDVFGNSVATAHFFTTANVLQITSTLLLRQMRGFPRRLDRPLLRPAYPLQFSPLEEFIVAAYRSSVFPADATGVAEWMQQEINPRFFLDAEALAGAINQKIWRSIRYRRREEKGVQTPGETLAAGSGSCRDLATLLMECLRTLGFPARFASGYLDCPASVAGVASTHAWAEAYLPEIGWIGFDPTLGTLTSRQHVVTGVSNHPRGVMPVSGTFFGPASVYLGMQVAVAVLEVEVVTDSKEQPVSFKSPA